MKLDYLSCIKKKSAVVKDPRSYKGSCHVLVDGFYSQNKSVDGKRNYHYLCLLFYKQLKSPQGQKKYAVKWRRLMMATKNKDGEFQRFFVALTGDTLPYSNTDFIEWDKLSAKIIDAIQNKDLNFRIQWNDVIKGTRSWPIIGEITPLRKVLVKKEYGMIWPVQATILIPDLKRRNEQLLAKDQTINYVEQVIEE